jgi:hypothetical protein
MPARLSQQDDENGMMEAACPQAVSAGLANSDGVGAPRLHPRYFLKSPGSFNNFLFSKSYFPAGT